MLHRTVVRRVLLLIGALVLVVVVQAGNSSAGSDAWNSDGPERGQPSQSTIPTYMEVVGQLDNLDYASDLESGYVLQETITVPVDGSSVSSTTILRCDTLYKIRASGTFFVGGPGDMQGDAEYANFSNPPSSLQNHCAGDPNDVDLGIGINDSANDNEKFPFWGNFEPSHVYAVTMAGRGAPISLNYHDCAYDDNSGYLTVEVWRPFYQIFLPFVVKTTVQPELYVLRGPDLQVPRSGHTATRLRDGRIMLVGGEQATDVFLADVNIFDPVTGSTSQAAPLHRERAGHTATLLPDGRVLVVGGYALPWQWLEDAEVYDPVQNTWTEAPPLHSHGLTHSGTLMRDGRVLVVGGNIGSSVFTERVEIFDPQTNSWTEAQPLEGERANHVAQLLEDGRVLVTGGQTDPSGLVGGDAVLYDPQTNMWAVAGPMVMPRIWAQSVQLNDGRVLVAGGMALDDMPTNTFTASVEIYDPVSDAWSAAPALSQPRYAYSLERLPNGQVLAVGGARDWECCWNVDSFVRAIEVYDPVANQWRTVANLPQPRAYPAAARLSDGRIWLSGGRTDSTFVSDTWWLVDAQTAARLGLR